MLSFFFIHFIYLYFFCILYNQQLFHHRQLRCVYENIRRLRIVAYFFFFAITICVALFFRMKWWFFFLSNKKRKKLLIPTILYSALKIMKTFVIYQCTKSFFFYYFSIFHYSVLVVYDFYHVFFCVCYFSRLYKIFLMNEWIYK